MYRVLNNIITFENWNSFIVFFIGTIFFTIIIIIILWPKLMVEFKEKENQNAEDNLEEVNQTSKFYLISPLIIGPYIETLVFQYLIFKLVNYFYRGNGNYILIAFIISTIVFSAVHSLPTRDWKSAFLRLPLSITLAYIYSASTTRNSYPIIYTTIFHALWNFMAIVLIPMGVDFSINDEKNA